MLLPHREQQVRRGVGEQGRHRDVHPQHGRAWQGTTLHSHDSEQHRRAQYQAGQGDLDWGQPADAQFDPQEARAPDQREQAYA